MPYIMKHWVTFLYFTVWFGSMLWCTSGHFIDAEITPKWHCAIFGTTLFFFISAGRAFHQSHPTLPFTTVSWAVMLCASSQALYGLLQKFGIYLPATTLPVCGSFDNPAGLSSALAFSLPFSLILTCSGKQWQRIAAWTSVVLITGTIMVSESRAGMLSACTVFLAFFPIKRTGTRKALFWGIVTGFVAAIVFLYHYKKDSADGRLLIWQCTWELIKESPLTGHGNGGFEANYMHQQADFFRLHPESPYSRLADDVKSPFNEYLGLCVSYGLVGAFFLCAVIWIIYLAWRRHPHGSSSTAILCLSSIAVFSLFSYPFRYPHTWFFCAVSISLLLHNAYPVVWHKSRRAILSACVLTATLISLRDISQIRSEIRWCDTANRSLCGLTDKMLPTYRELYEELNKNPLFLYNYAAELNVAGHHAESYRIGQECESLMADYYTQLLQADNCKRLKRYEEAKRYLRQAALMCPNRFTPPYELFKIYHEESDTASMAQTAECILRKPIKVDSPEVHRILSEIKKFKTDIRH